MSYAFKILAESLHLCYNTYAYSCRLKLIQLCIRGPGWVGRHFRANEFSVWNGHLRFFMSAKWQLFCLLVGDIQHNFLIFSLTKNLKIKWFSIKKSIAFIDKAIVSCYYMPICIYRYNEDILNSYQVSISIFCSMMKYNILHIWREHVLAIFLNMI